MEKLISHWLLRIPLAVVFLQQGLNKLPFDPTGGEGFGLPALVWFFVVYGEILAGLGLLVGGLFAMTRLYPWVGDTVTRLSGFTVGSIMTGVIWSTQPTSFVDVILYDNFHVLLWFGGLYFALRGNNA